VQAGAFAVALALLGCLSVGAGFEPWRGRPMPLLLMTRPARLLFFSLRRCAGRLLRPGAAVEAPVFRRGQVQGLVLNTRHF
jgi:hypothetical protein